MPFPRPRPPGRERRRDAETICMPWSAPAAPSSLSPLPSPLAGVAAPAHEQEQEQEHEQAPRDSARFGRRGAEGDASSSGVVLASESDASLPRSRHAARRRANPCVIGAAAGLQQRRVRGVVPITRPGAPGAGAVGLATSSGFRRERAAEGESAALRPIPTRNGAGVLPPAALRKSPSMALLACGVRASRLRKARRPTPWSPTPQIAPLRSIVRHSYCDFATSFAVFERIIPDFPKKSCERDKVWTGIYMYAFDCAGRGP